MTPLTQRARRRFTKAMPTTRGAANSRTNPATATHPWTTSGSPQVRKQPEKPNAEIMSRANAGTAATAYPTATSSAACHQRRGLVGAKRLAWIASPAEAGGSTGVGGWRMAPACQNHGYRPTLVVRERDGLFAEQQQAQP